MLENQITKIIKQATVEIRKQGSEVKWEKIKLDSRIRPMIPYNIINSQNDEHKKIVDLITQHQNVPIVKLISLFQEKEKEIGKLIFMTKNLEQNGILEHCKKMMRTSVMTNFYEKANFTSIRKQ